MLETAATKYRILLANWTALVRRGAWGVVGLALLFTALSVNYLIENTRINTDTTDMLSADLPFRQFDREMSAAFPEMSDNLLVVIDGHTPDLADHAALAMAARMRAAPKVFGNVHDIAGEVFFRRNGLLYLDVDELYDLSDKLAEAQPFLGSLWQDLSLRGLFAMLGKAIDVSGRTDIGQPVEIASILNSLAAVGEAQLRGEFSQISWRDLMQGKDDGANANRRFLLVKPPLDFDSLSPASDVMDAVRALAVDMGFGENSGVRVRLSGSAALAQEELESVEEGMGLAGILSLTLVLILLAVGLKRVSLVIATILTLLMGLIWTAAFAIIALGALNLISVAFAVLFIGLSVDFGIHYALRYKEAVDEGSAQGEALERAASGVGGALTLSAICAAIAFYSFLPTDYQGLAELGLIAGTGMFIALFANVTVLPALLSLTPISARRGAKTTNTLPAFAFQTFVKKRARGICLVFMVVGGIALMIAPKVDFDFDPLNLKDRSTESMATLVDLMADSRTSPYSIEILMPDLESAKKTAEQLGKLNTVKQVETLADYVPLEQDEKLAVIRTMALFLAPAMSGDGERAKLDDDMRAGTVRAFLGKLSVLADKGAVDDKVAAKRLEQVLRSALKQGNAELAELEARYLVSLPAQLALLKQSLEARAVTLKDLPHSVTQRQITGDGRVRIEVYPKEDLQDRDALVRFVDEVREVAPRAIGSPVVILEAGRAVLRSFFQAGAMSVIVIAMLLLIILGKLRDVMLVFAPLLLAGVFSLAATVLFGLSFNFANVIVLPLLFGLGVAGGIHLVSRDAGEGGGGAVLETSTPRAVMFSALTTIGSFGSIALSSHPGTSSMGVLLTVAISLTLLCTLIFLPALMAMVSGKVTRE